MLTKHGQGRHGNHLAGRQEPQGQYQSNPQDGAEEPEDSMALRWKIEELRFHCPDHQFRAQRR